MTQRSRKTSETTPDKRKCIEALESDRRRLSGDRADDLDMVLERLETGSASAAPDMAAEIREARAELARIRADGSPLAGRIDAVEEMLLAISRRQMEAAENAAAADELAEARATCALLEETVSGMENRLLETIARCGELHRKLDSMQEEVCTARAQALVACRQRDEVRRRLDALRHENLANIDAIASAEREINTLVDRLGGGADGAN